MSAGQGHVSSSTRSDAVPLCCPIPGAVMDRTLSPSRTQRATRTRFQIRTIYTHFLKTVIHSLLLEHASTQSCSLTAACLPGVDRGTSHVAGTGPVRCIYGLVFRVNTQMTVHVIIVTSTGTLKNHVTFTSRHQIVLETIHRLNCEMVGERKHGFTQIQNHQPHDPAAVSTP